jgi:DNA-binding MarR family transcriptional regulator
MSSDAPADDAVEALMAASRVITAAVAHSLATLDTAVTMPQLRVLVMITGRGPLNLAAVAEGLGVNPSNASRTCDRLVGAGLLDRREDHLDRRNVVLTLTRAGMQLVNAVMRERREVLEQVVQRMAAADRATLAAGLAAFTGAAAEVGDGRHDEAHLLRWLA